MPRQIDDAHFDAVADAEHDVSHARRHALIGRHGRGQAQAQQQRQSKTAHAQDRRMSRA